MVTFHPKAECKRQLASLLRDLRLPMRAAHTVSDGIAFISVYGITKRYDKEEIMDKFLPYCSGISYTHHW